MTTFAFTFFTCSVKKKSSVQCDSEVDPVDLKSLSVLNDLRFSVCLVVVEVECTHFCFTLIGVQ